ncbi:hypothetical protein [Variibacter gotjawalensis]|uniref:hypothetical protein n=1 Tax=Variibacter gotjawalensis TaxID=1333996 RepID=UPI000BBAF0EA|nr:hypothetical protein [Variibacter gotjawalensis]NIK49751.1 hypothetical protein [Variibacter gotjawalensis]
MTDDKEKPSKVVQFPPLRAAKTKADCLTEARRLMRLADETSDFELRAGLLREAGAWLARAKATHR